MHWCRALQPAPSVTWPGTPVLGTIRRTARARGTCNTANPTASRAGYDATTPRSTPGYDATCAPCTLYDVPATDARTPSRQWDCALVPKAWLVDPAPRIVHSRVHALLPDTSTDAVHAPCASHGHVMGPSSGDTPGRRILACVAPVINDPTHPSSRTCSPVPTTKSCAKAISWLLTACPRLQG